MASLLLLYRLLLVEAADHPISYVGPAVRFCDSMPGPRGQACR
jgi:hypothetical protein